MSRYLRFALDRVQAPRPKQIVILRHQHNWANQQLVDEFKFQFHDCSVRLTETVDANHGDLLVVPYMHDFFNELPGGKRMYACLRKENDSWVMLYGLGYRKILVMPANHLMGYYKSGKRLLRMFRILCLLHMVRVVRRLRRFLELR